jgi:DNA repair protein RadD
VRWTEAARAGPAIAGADPRIELTRPKALNQPATSTEILGQPTVTLRPYQVDSVAGTREAYLSGVSRVCLVAPTGSGKTVMFAHVIANAAQRGRRTLIIVHRVELVEQVADALELAGVDYGVVAPGHSETNNPVQIASVATLAQPRRLERWRDRFGLVVVDEAHHAVSPTWARVIGSQPNSKVLGCTATPERLDGRGLAEQFDVLVEGPTVAELIAGEWLSPFVVFEPTSAPDMSAAKIRGGDFAVEDLREAIDGIVVGAAVTEYVRLCPGVLRSRSASTLPTAKPSLSASSMRASRPPTLTARRPRLSAAQ